MSPDLSWLSALHDIHPGPLPGEANRLPALGMCAAALLALMLTLHLLRVMTQRLYWRYHSQELPWDELHDALRELSAKRWPELAALPTAAWLGALDTLTGSQLQRWQPQWDGWRFGPMPPGPISRDQLDGALRPVFRALFPLWPSTRSQVASSGGRR